MICGVGEGGLLIERKQNLFSETRGGVDVDADAPQLGGQSKPKTQWRGNSSSGAAPSSYST